MYEEEYYEDDGVSGYELAGDDYLEGEEYELAGDYEMDADYDGGMDPEADDELGFRFPSMSRLLRRRRPKRRTIRRAAPRRIVRRSSPAALASSPVPGAVTAIRSTPQKPDGFSFLPLDTGSVLVPAGGSVTIDAKCQQTFKPMNIVFDGGVSPDFVVTSIKCGNDEQLVSSGQIPASNFGVDNSRNQMNLAVIKPALSLLVTVVNISGAPRRLRGHAGGFKFD